MQKVPEPIQRVRVTESAPRQASIREQKGPSLGKFYVKAPHQRSPYAMKFEDKSHEETERQQSCARSKAWNLAKKHLQAQTKRQGCILLSRGGMGTPGCVNKRAGGETVVVDPGAKMHMVSKKDLNAAELETMRTSRSPTTVMTANGEVQTREEATVYVKELDLCVTVMLLEETPAVLSLGKLCENHGCTYHWASGQNHISSENGKRIDLQYIQQCTICGSGLSASSFSTTPSPTSPSSSSQDSVFYVNRYTENPVPERSGSMSEELRGDTLHESTKTENKNKNEESEDTSKSSHELPMDPRAEVEPGSGEQSVYTHFPKDQIATSA